MNRDLQNQIKLCVEQTLQESKTPGATVAIYREGQLFISMGVGYQDLKHKELLMK